MTDREMIENIRYFYKTYKKAELIEVVEWFLAYADDMSLPIKNKAEDLIYYSLIHPYKYFFRLIFNRSKIL